MESSPMNAVIAFTVQETVAAPETISLESLKINC